LRLGFDGYVTKDAQIEQFRNSIKTIVEGQVVVPRRAARPMAGARNPEERHAALLAEQLTSREREILELLADGLDGVDISRKLCADREAGLGSPRRGRGDAARRRGLSVRRPHALPEQLPAELGAVLHQD